MAGAPLPPNERDRLEKLALYRILDTPPEEAFDRITRIVAETVGVPISLISLIDEDRQWVKSSYGPITNGTSRDLAFCAHAILGDEMLEIEDTTKDPRFADNPLVTGEPHIRFYAGAPLRTPEGFNVGSLSAIDTEPRKLSDKHRQLLVDLADLVVDEMELRVALRAAMNDAAKEVKQRAVVDEFLSMITHELRTPLTSIRGSLGLIDGGAMGDVPENMRDMIAIASRNVGSLLQLVNDLLDFSKLETGELNFDFETMDATDVLRETCENLAGYAVQREIKLELALDDTTVITGDKSRIAQMLANIVSNAIKFSPPGAIVTAKVSGEGGHVRYSITDQGAGIPKDFRDRVFDKFTQGPSDHKIKGTGLGLAISKAIAEAHRGRIYFDSVPGVGTTFHVDLPIQPSLAVDGGEPAHTNTAAQ